MPQFARLASPDSKRKEVESPDEVAAAALFLASEDSSFVNGIELFVDGGSAQI